MAETRKNVVVASPEIDAKAERSVRRD